MKPRDFTILTQRHSCYHTGVGQTGAETLINMLQTPLPHRHAGNSTGDAKSQSMGSLIRHGLARFNPGSKHYEATEKGRDWIQTLQQHKILENCTKQPMEEMV